MVEYLVKKGSNMEAKGESGYTPLHYASINGHLPVVEYLVKKGADTEAKNKNGYTPLHLASDKGHRHVVEHLVEERADMEATDNVRQSTLLIIIYNMHDEY